MPDAMQALPQGTVTFLFTDIEGSTRMWEHEPERMTRALARHDALMRDAIERNGGVVFKTVGDAFCAAFATAAQALASAFDAQCALRGERWATPDPIRVRMALHTGAAEVRDDDYFGQPLNRAARLLGAGHGGQVLLSLAAQELVRDALPPGFALRDLGERRLKDLIRPEHVWQLLAPGLPDEFPPLRTLDARTHNLPVQSTSFVGRERETAEVRRLVATSRLVTLTGAGGAGKTRLALQVAADVIDEFGDGVRLVDLSSLAEPSLVPAAAARVFDVAEPADGTTTAALAAALRERELLLVLDNCEHLIVPSAALCAALLGACPGLRILATSREPLRIDGETAFRVPPLTVPVAATPRRIAALLPYDAVRLFIDRALAADAQFRVDNASAPALASICQRLDGIPLAIELAAARVRGLSLDDIDRRLDHRFALLTGGSRVARPRQQTLRALIDWSYDLLAQAERLLLARLCVFAGGFDLAAAEAVGGDGLDAAQVLDLVGSLVDKSLLVADEHNGTKRYGMLETVREYAHERLAARGEVTECERRHLRHLVALAEALAPRLGGADQHRLLDALEAEHDNLRAALSRAAAAQDPEAALDGLRLAGATFLFWGVRGHLREGRAWLARMLDAAPSASNRPLMRALRAAASLAWRQGDCAQARALYERGLAVARDLGDRGWEAGALADLGGVASDQGDFGAARAYLEECLVLQREVGNRNALASALHALAGLSRANGDHAQARKGYEEAIALWRQIGDPRMVAMGIGNLGLVELAMGAHDAARSAFEESLATFVAIGERQGAAISTQNLGLAASAQGDWPVARARLVEALATFRDLGDRIGVAEALEALGGVAARDRGPLDAAALWGCAERLREELGTPLTPVRRAEHDALVEHAAARSGSRGDFDRAWRQGRAKAPDDTIDALAPPSA